MNEIEQMRIKAILILIILIALSVIGYKLKSWIEFKNMPHAWELKEGVIWQIK